MLDAVRAIQSQAKMSKVIASIVRASPILARFCLLVQVRDILAYIPFES